MIAALFVRKNGPYFNINNIDPWDEEKDARNYSGPYPVIAHPPCQRWGKMFAGSPSVIAKTGKRYKLGDDGGCFESALRNVRLYGGILEHPYGSKAFTTFGITVPPRQGGWVEAGDGIGWVCCVEQGQYGHYCRKPTILYAVNTSRPELRWGETEAIFSDYHIQKYGLNRVKRIGEMSLKGGGRDSPIRIDTPREFKELLISMIEQ